MERIAPERRTSDAYSPPTRRLSTRERSIRLTVAHFISMSIASQTMTERVRGLIRETFGRLGVASEEVRETILIRDGYYCGRRYECAGLQAIWFIEENQLKFHSQDGRVLEVRSAGEAVREAA